MQYSRILCEFSNAHIRILQEFYQPYAMGLPVTSFRNQKPHIASPFEMSFHNSYWGKLKIIDFSETAKISIINFVKIFI